MYFFQKINPSFAAPPLKKNSCCFGEANLFIGTVLEDECETEGKILYPREREIM